MCLKHRTQVGVAWPLLLSLFMGLCLYGCDETPMAPIYEEPELKDYVVYCWDGRSEREFWGYHPTTGVVDSFTIPFVFPWYGFHVSADGKYFYVRQNTSFAVVGVDSLNLVVDLPYTARNGLAVSPDNRWIALQGGGLRILSTDDYSVAYEDTTLGIMSGVFSHDSRKLYLVGGGTDSTIVVVDMENNFTQTVHSFPSGLSIWDVEPSPDESRWYLIRGGGYLRLFEVWDMASDSVIFRHYMYPGVGEMVVSPDGDHVFLTEAGSVQHADGPPYFTVYDSRRNRISMLVATGGIDDGFSPRFMSLGELTLTPDGNWLIAGEGIGGQSFLRFNIKTMEVDDYHFIAGEGLRSYTCQNGI